MKSSNLNHLIEELEQVEQCTDKRLQQYYIQLAEVGEESQEKEEFYQEIQQEVKDLKQTSGKLLNCHLKMKANVDELETRLKDVQASQKKRLIISPPPANSVIDLEEQKAGHFAQGLNFYKMFLVCFIGSFAGVVIEMLWCLISNGYIESRAGLVYGPFNLLYGVGAVCLTWALYKYRNRSSSISFLGGMIVGSAVEYICSWGQELVLGSRSWDYSNMPFNLNGRICLLYSIFWGILGVLWIKNIYPRMAKWILKIPNRAGKIITWLLVAFMIANIVMTSLSLARWVERIQDKPASNGIENWLDDHFPDERMEKIFANMEFSKKDS